MTDINRMTMVEPLRQQSVTADQTDAAEPSRDQLLACVELLFFAYRDFTGDPDAVLEKYGFGRAHHRVLHFVERNPGLRVASLLDILKITKQSLARVLKQLIDQDFITQKTGPEDRRERLLYVTQKGAKLAEKLTDLQIKRIAAALNQAGPGSRDTVTQVLLGMIAETDRAQVALMIETGKGKGGTR
jgi:DNA-binding MarR family transcriptional regulator